MKQVVQDISSGKTTIRHLPDPIALPGQVVVANRASLISAGTERYVVELAKKSLWGKARQRPDHVRRVLEKLKQEGLISTVNQLRAKLDEPMPLGYSSSGIVLECGRGVHEFKPGDRVATAGPHAGVVSISRNLCARIPDNVSFEQAAYTAVAAIGLEGVRLARVSLGERVVVIGLGLIGQICVCLLKAQGCSVFGIDLDDTKLKLASSLGADVVAAVAGPDDVRAFTDNQGVDAVVITAATDSNQPIEFAAEVCRQRGRIVLVGVVGLTLPRQPFFEKELEFTVSSSLGPGRGDPQYEERGVDYPIGHARWTAQRNMQAVLATIASGKLPAERLTSHRFAIDHADKAYDLVTNPSETFYGIVLTYPDQAVAQRRLSLRAPASDGSLGVSLIGAGNFARLIMLPMLNREMSVSWKGLCTAKGMNAEHSARKHGFTFATTDVEEIWRDESTRAVLIATRHDLHAELVIAALRAGKHVFVEKPLCIRPEELTAIAECVEDLGGNCPILMVGFNRRFAPATRLVRDAFACDEKLTVHYRFAPGPLPTTSWTQDEEVGGGRIVGEACHAIDTCAALTGSPPVRVFAESLGGVSRTETSDDSVFITLRHANGSISTVSYQARGDKRFPAERIEVFGGGRTAVIESWNRIEIWQQGKVVHADGGKDKGHQAEFHEFLSTARRGGRWPIEWDHLYGVTWASLMAVRSLRDGLPQMLDGFPGES